MNAEEKFEIVSAMKMYGGGFVKALATAWERADAQNCAKIQQAFPEYIDQYREISKRAKVLP